VVEKIRPGDVIETVEVWTGRWGPARSTPGARSSPGPDQKQKGGETVHPPGRGDVWPLLLLGGLLRRLLAALLGLLLRRHSDYPPFLSTGWPSGARAPSAQEKTLKGRW